MSCTLQHPAADTGLRKAQNIVSQGHRHVLPSGRAWLLARAASRYAVQGGLRSQDCMQGSNLVSVGRLLVTRPPWTWAVQMKILICWLSFRKAPASVDLQGYW